MRHENTTHYDFNDLPERYKSQTGKLLFVVDRNEARLNIQAYRDICIRLNNPVALEWLINVLEIQDIDDEYVSYSEIINQPGSPAQRTIYRYIESLIKLSLLSHTTISNYPKKGPSSPSLYTVQPSAKVTPIQAPKHKTRKEIYEEAVNTELAIRKRYGSEVVSELDGDIVYRDAFMMQVAGKTARIDLDDKRTSITAIGTYLNSPVEVTSVADADSELWIEEDIADTLIYNTMIINQIEAKLRKLSLSDRRLLNNDEALLKAGVENSFVVPLSYICSARGIANRPEHRAKVFNAALRLNTTKLRTETVANSEYSLTFLGGADLENRRYFTEFRALTNVSNNSIFDELGRTYDPKGNIISPSDAKKFNEDAYQWIRFSIWQESYKDLCKLALLHWRETNLTDPDERKQIRHFSTPISDVKVRNKLWHRLISYLRFATLRKNEEKTNTVELRAKRFSNYQRYDVFSVAFFDLINHFQTEQSKPSISRKAESFTVDFGEFILTAERMTSEEASRADRQIARNSFVLDSIGRKRAWHLKFRKTNVPTKKRPIGTGNVVDEPEDQIFDNEVVQPVNPSLDLTRSNSKIQRDKIYYEVLDELGKHPDDIEELSGYFSHNLPLFDEVIEQSGPVTHEDWDRFQETLTDEEMRWYSRLIMAFIEEDPHLSRMDARIRALQTIRDRQ